MIIEPSISGERNWGLTDRGLTDLNKEFAEYKKLMELKFEKLRIDMTNKLRGVEEERDTAISKNTELESKIIDLNQQIYDLNHPKKEADPYDILQNPITQQITAKSIKEYNSYAYFGNIFHIVKGKKIPEKDVFKYYNKMRETMLSLPYLTQKQIKNNLGEHLRIESPHKTHYNQLTFNNIDYIYPLWSHS